MTLLKDQCVSVTDFRKNTIKYFQLSKKHPIYVFANNKLVGKIVDPSTVQWDDYNFTITFDAPKKASELLSELQEDA